MAKKAAKKKTASSSTLQVKLTRAHQAAAQKCLARSGKITMSMKPVSVTRLPKSLSARMVTMD